MISYKGVWGNVVGDDSEGQQGFLVSLAVLLHVGHTPGSDNESAYVLLRMFGFCTEEAWKIYSVAAVIFER